MDFKAIDLCKGRSGSVIDCLLSPWMYVPFSLDPFLDHVFVDKKSDDFTEVSFPESAFYF